MLNKTKKFSVFSLENDQINSNELNKNNNKKVSFFLIGGKKITLDEIFKIISQSISLSLDLNILEEIKNNNNNNNSKNNSFNISNLKIQTKNVFLPIELSKSAIIYTINSLMQGKSGIRSIVIETLVELFNNNNLPLFTSVENAQEELILTLLGQYPYCYSSNGGFISSSQALSLAGLSPITLLDSEGSTLLNGEFTFPGFVSLITLGAVRTFKTIDVISAFSSDSLGISTTAFDAENFDTLRPHRGQMTSASNLRMMLESSGNINTVNNPLDLSSFIDIPQVNGPTNDLINTALKTIEVELNSTQIGPFSQSKISLNSTQTQLALNSIIQALQSASQLTQERVKVLGGEIDNILTISQKFDLPITQQLILAYNQVFRLSRLLATELYLTSKRLNLNSSNTFNSGNNNSNNQNIKSHDGDNDENEEHTKGGKSTSLEGLTEAQIARIEAKRKAKADKAAQKAKSKEAKKGTTVSEESLFASRLGHGTSKVRDFVLRLELYKSIEACISALNPFYPNYICSTDGSFSDFSTNLLQKLEAGTGGKRKTPKIPKGTRDFLPDQMRIREQAFGVIRRVFKRHGAVEIDTPVFELKEVLTGKYGEDSKLIYDLADQGGELLSLRYDLTVPFARFLAMNSLGNIKRYHMAKVYRRDNPAINRGRYREFYQCDFDVAGSYRPMIPDAEVIAVATEILSELPIGSFMLKINHRGILDAIFEIAGVPTEKFRPICSAVDKLDKAEWAEVKAEMVDEKGLASEVADRIGEFVLNKGEPREMLQRLLSSNLFGNHKGALKALEDMGLLFDYLDAMGSLQYLSFDLSLARGLDYYTGVIYEAVLTDGISQLGSIAAGGRYDNLVGMFSASGQQTPCVGVSIGVERVFAIMEKKAAESAAAAKHSDIQVYIASIGAGYVPERMRVAKLLWKNNIPSEYSHLENPKFKKQLDEALERYIPVMVVFGEDELKRGVVKVKNMQEHNEIEVEYNEASLVHAVLNAGARQTMANVDVSLIDALK